jgi:hypothetical protein
MAFGLFGKRMPEPVATVLAHGMGDSNMAYKLASLTV